MENTDIYIPQPSNSATFIGLQMQMHSPQQQCMYTGYQYLVCDLKKKDMVLIFLTVAVVYATVIMHIEFFSM